MNLTLLAFLRKELTQTLRDPRMRMIVFMVPVVQMTVFGLALSNEIKNVRLAVYAKPGDTLAEEVAQRAEGSGWFHRVPASDPDPFVLVRSGRAEVAFVMPVEGTERAFARGQVPLQVLIDASNAVKGRVVETYLQAVFERVLRDRSPERAPPKLLRFDVRVLYNPTLRTSAYLVPGVMGLILCMITILLTSMSLARERELGTFETLVASPAALWEIYLGKTLPYMLLGLLDVPLLIAVAVGGFGVPLRGPLWALGLAALIFIITTVNVGTLISSFARNQQQAMMGGFLFLFPAIQLSGVMAPIDNIPVLFVPISWLNPLRFFVSLMRQVMLKGTLGPFYWIHLAALAALGAAAATLSVRRFRRSVG